MVGTILAAILPALIGSMTSGSQESGNDSQISGQLEKYIGNMLQNGMPQYKGDTTAEFNMPDYMNDVINKYQQGAGEYGGDLTSEFETPEYLQNVISQYQQGAGEYEGDLNVDPSQMQNQLSDMVSSMLNGDNLGMSEEEMSQMYNKQKTNLDDARQQGISNTIEGMNSRGILSSDITGNNLRGISENYSDALGDSMTDIQLQNENLKRNQKNNAMNTGMNLGQMQNNLNMNNNNMQYQDWTNQQNMNSQNLNNLAGLGQWQSGMESNADMNNNNMQYQDWTNQQNMNSQNLNNLAGLGQWQAGTQLNSDQWNTGNQMSNFYNQQNLNQQPYQMGMNYLTGYEAPNKQNKQRQDNNDSAMWGNVAGTVVNALPWG